MHIKREYFQYLPGMLLMVCLVSSILALAAPDTPGDSPYRLKTSYSPAAAQETSNNIYRLDRKYRPPEPPASNPALPPEALKAGTPEIDHPLASALADQPYSKEITKAALAAELDPALVHAVIFVESGYRHSAVSNKGAIGLMQVLPDTAARYGIKSQKMSPKANLHAGTLYLKYLMRMFDNRMDLALAAYNAGEGSVQRYSNRIPPYRETQQYVRAVLAKYNEWRNVASIEKNRMRLAQAQMEEKPDSEKDRAKQEISAYLTGTRIGWQDPMPTSSD